MVEKLTLFEFHVDEPRFGTNDTVADPDEQGGQADASAGSERRDGRLVLACVLSFAARRFVGAPTETEVESIDGSPAEPSIGIGN